jgi:hypothetical protein
VQVDFNKFKSADARDTSPTWYWLYVYAATDKCLDTGARCVRSCAMRTELGQSIILESLAASRWRDHGINGFRLR